MEPTIAAEVIPWLANARAASAIVTALAVLVGGVVGLRRYRHGLKIKAGELLLEMEREFRAVLPTFFEIELLFTYRRKYAPTLAKNLRRADLSDSQIERLKEIDRCLRFFYLCTVLHTDLRIEQAILARSYYWYVRLLVDGTLRPELEEYVEANYRRLSQWVHEHLPCFDEYERSGRWKPRLRDRRWHRSLDGPTRRWRTTGVSLIPLRSGAGHEILVESLAPDLGTGFREAMDDWRSRRERPYPLQDWHVFVARDVRDGDGVGICGFYRHPDDDAGRYWLGWLGVAPASRRRGYGSAMVGAVADEVTRRGARELWVYVDGEDAGARAFYRANGFEERTSFAELGLEQAAADDQSLAFARVL